MHVWNSNLTKAIYTVEALYKIMPWVKRYNSIKNRTNPRMWRAGCDTTSINLEPALKNIPIVCTRRLRSEQVLNVMFSRPYSAVQLSLR